MKRSDIYTVLFCCACLTAVAGFAEKKYEYSWQNPHATVLPNGDLEWAPKPFVFQAGESVRYIDYETGNDRNDGESKRSPWKHHPWDENATDNAKAGNGVHTYVFKKGVMYRGTLLSKKSGEKENPIRLTSDPSWGGTPLNHRSGIADYKLIQGVVPQNMWVIDDEKVTRIPVCREPNWTEETSHPDDPHTEWFVWEKRDDKFKIDTKNLGGFEKDFFEGGIVHTENYVPPFGNMGTDTSHKITHYDKDKMALQFDATFIKKGNRYFIENVPGFLDEPGEFYCAQEFSSAEKQSRKKSGKPNRLSPHNIKPGRLFVRLPNRPCILEILDNDNIVVSGLQFSFDNNGTLKEAFSWPTHRTVPTAIRIIGDSSNITIANNGSDSHSNHWRLIQHHNR